MKYLLILLSCVLVIQKSVAPPVTKNKKESESENEVEDKEELANIMEYHRYLQEVVKALESDSDFRQKLEKTDEKDIRNGEIANQLEFVNHHVRTKLDELKRIELERLRHLATKQFELENGLDSSHLKIPEHVDHENPHTFEIEDLKKLISKTTKDLDEADKKRREEFKEYEMQKEFEQDEKKKNMTEVERQNYENELRELEKRRKEHEPVHHPGSKKQLEEVWEKQDHMENQVFDPKTFFYLHDLDGNHYWDQTELKALFMKELDKLYKGKGPEVDPVERHEELERMREHVLSQADLNNDGLISYDEFLAESKKAEFEQDPGWESLNEQELYSKQEYEAYAQAHQRVYPDGLPPNQQYAGQQQFAPQVPQHDYIPQQHDYMQQPQYANQQQHYPPQGQYQQAQPGQYNQMHGQQMPPQHVPPQHMQPQHAPPHQVPPAQYAHQQAGQQHHQQNPVNTADHQQQNLVPVNHPNQVPVNHPNQVPVNHPNQVPVNQAQQQQPLPPAVQKVNEIPVQSNQNQPNTQNQIPH